MVASGYHLAQPSTFVSISFVGNGSMCEPRTCCKGGLIMQKANAAQLQARKNKREKYRPSRLQFRRWVREYIKAYNRRAA